LKKTGLLPRYALHAIVAVGILELGLCLKLTLKGAKRVRFVLNAKKELKLGFNAAIIECVGKDLWVKRL
jgi:hypothetical protein